MKLMGKLLQFPLTAGLLVSTLVFLIILGVRITGLFESLELAAYDEFIRLRKEVSGPDSRIVLVKITEKDIWKQGHWPLSDATLAHVMTILNQYQPRAIGLDIYRDVSVPPGRKELNAILTGNPHIITAMKFGVEGDSGIPPPPVLSDKDQAVGFNDIVVDPGGIVRRGLLFLDDGKKIVYSFALRLALLYLQAEGITPKPDGNNPEHVRLAQTTIRPFEQNDGGYVGADSRGYQFLLNLRGAQKGFLSYSLTSLLSGEIDSETIKDKIVIIGVTAEGVKDFFYTSFSRGLQADQQISGIALHAHIVSQFLRFGLEGKSPIKTFNEWYEGFWILLWSLMGGIVSLRIRSPWHFSLSAASGLLILSLTVYVAFLNEWWIPSVPPAMAWLISAAIVTAYMLNREKAQRSFLMQLFSRHVDKEVAEAIWEKRDQFLDGGRPRPQRLIASVLFTDLIGFTSVSEKLDPQSLMDWLNQYMDAMAQQVGENGGVINKYIGDAIMAIFGVPLARKTEAEIDKDAVNAVNCALAMEKKLIQLNSIWQEQELPTVGMRIGIFTGPLVAGSLGSAQRLEYTVIGDTVNTASRLESFDKKGFYPDLTENPCRILIGKSTLRYLGHQFKTQMVGEVGLKGKDQKTTVYRIVRDRGTETPT